MTTLVIHRARSYLVPPAKLAVRGLRRLLRPARLGSLRRTTPISTDWGFDRGSPIDRHTIERFLESYRQDIRGRVLEVKDTRYTDRFGGEVERKDVLDLNPQNPHATIIADLTAADAIPTATYDCFILTQVLQYIYDTPAALRHAHRILKPGGVLLATAPAVGRIDPYCPESEFWRFTAPACARLFGEIFGAEQITLHSYGNVLTCIAALAGLAAEELSRQELSIDDPYFPLTIGIRAVKRTD